MKKNALRKWRQEHGFSVAQCAKKIKITQAAWRNYENGFPPKRLNMEKIKKLTDYMISEQDLW